MTQVHGAPGTYHVDYGGGGEAMFEIAGDVLTYNGETYLWNDEYHCWELDAPPPAMPATIYLYDTDDMATEGFFGYIPIGGGSPKTGNWHT